MKQLMACVLMLGALAGCALTTDQIDLKYNSMISNTVVPGADAVVVEVRGRDGRTSNLDTVSVKKNGFGMEMAPIIAKQNLPDLVKSAVQQELTKEGFRIGPGHVFVDVELDRFYNDFKEEVFSGSEVAEVTLATQVKTADGRILYARTLTGEGDEGGLMLASGANAKLALQKAFSACVARLVSDPDFTQALLKAGQMTARAIS